MTVYCVFLSGFDKAFQMTFACIRKSPEAYSKSRCFLHHYQLSTNFSKSIFFYIAFKSKTFYTS